MSTITIDVSDRIYRDFEDYAKRVDRTPPELIREAMELYRDQRMTPKRLSLTEMPSFSVGEILKPLGSDDDLLGEMLEGTIE
jgi:hypothetical protein